ncbi:hypothetical protein FPQ18DRAFT_386157 [Pyronema domesticum]|nr:hypothetical protein FPQ18DRAFT_386157 [Pyronema domesticum]
MSWAGFGAGTAADPKMGELLDLSLEILTVCQCKRGIERLGRTFKIFNRPEVEMLEKLTKKLAVFAWPVLEYTKRGMVKGQSNRWSLILESYDKKKARKSGTGGPTGWPSFAMAYTESV